MSPAAVPHPLAPDADPGEVVATVREHGYAVLEDVLEREALAPIRSELDRLLERTPLGRNDFEGHRTRRVYNLFGKTRALDAMALHPLLLATVDELLGLYQFSAPVGIQIGPGERAQVLHHDDVVYPLPWPHDEVIVNSMWAFDDFTEANGATRIAPGSHRRPMAEYPQELATVPAVMRAGSVMVYTGTVLHGGGANRTDHPRLGVILEFVQSWLRPQENHLLGIAPEVLRSLPHRLQELLGLNVHPPFLGYVDGRHPARALDT